MNIRDLKYLVAVAEFRHFGQAAKASFVSQPALSMQLKKLEEELSIQLFERSNKKVMITPVGEAMVAQAREILKHADAMVVLAKTYTDPLAGEIRLGAFPTLAPYFLPKIVPEMMETFPKVKLLLSEEKTEILIQKLEEGKVDAALLALPVEAKGLEVVPLFSEEFYLAVSSAHPLAKQAHVTQSQLAGESLLLLEEGHCMRDQALDVCSLIGMSEHQDFRATSLETLRQMVVANVGMTLMPACAIGKSDTKITYIPFTAPAPSRSIGMLWRKTSAREPLLRAIANLLTVSPNRH